MSQNYTKGSYLFKLDDIQMEFTLAVIEIIETERFYIDEVGKVLSEKMPDAYNVAMALLEHSDDGPPNISLLILLMSLYTTAYRLIITKQWMMT